MAVKENKYYQQVNRRILAVRFLLKKINSTGSALSPVERQALKESAQLQFYLTFVSYLHELLSYYNRPIPDENKTDLASLFCSHQSPLSTIPEFVFLQRWNQERDNIIGVFSTLINDLVFPHEVNAKEEMVSDGGENGVGLTLIASDSHTTNDIHSISHLLSLINDFQTLVDMQRENQAEY